MTKLVQVGLSLNLALELVAVDPVHEASAAFPCILKPVRPFVLVRLI